LASDRIGIVVGLRAEARIARRAGWLVAIGGGTPAGAESAARTLVAQGVTALVSFGLAGGLDPALQAGDVVVPSYLLADGARLPTDPTLFGRADGRTLLCGETAVASAAEKRHLFEMTGAVAVDLESGAVARVALEHGLRFAALRAICDPAGRSLPRAALVALDARGGIGVLRVLRSLAVRPDQLPMLLALARDAASARRSLMRAIPSPPPSVCSSQPQPASAGEGEENALSPLGERVG
jgi:adenosylhomocysteine nucleosidase